MSRYVITWERPFERVQDRDAYAVGLVVDCDGQRLGLWTAMVSGIAIRSEPAEWGERHRAALAVVGAQGVEAAIKTERPGGWQLEAHLLAVHAPDVERLAASVEVLPTGPSDEPVLTFDAE